MENTSGTTIRVPVTKTLSPGEAFSTCSPLRMISMVLGTAPEGRSELLS
jgi:hypothetical protein